MPPPPAEPAEPVSVVIPVHNAAVVLPAVVDGWVAELGKLGREYEVLIVDDGSTDESAARADEVAARQTKVRVLRHETHRGFGACLRTALAEAAHPLFFYTATDYPYTPADLAKLLDRIKDTDEMMSRKIDVVSGCRTGRPLPAFWKGLGLTYRVFCRVAFGLSLEPLPGWFGFREHLRSWFAWLVFGVPLTDPHSAFKLFRKTVFDRFPIQCDGDLVHIELIAKATFTICLMDELPLTPKPDPIPKARWTEFWKLFNNPKFTPPAAPTQPAPVVAPEPPPEPFVASAPIQS
ncbi:glycosyltransferase family 2 protein [Fimbriiglobus ruber]|uniref:Glycosyl transferase, group 2 family protein n=1 Tax=Fimbriiglobus ruber TaxID=1908690 RepID=A0A225DWQ7_9BACT|nr:glycosyltransferase family 2 protein [Fimbriiglobus ruber]OWK40597.1 Glycosyl transferase, group 2 family protein [Fimbriiglobus ruber]